MPDYGRRQEDERFERLSTTIARLDERIHALDRSQQELSRQCVTKPEFWPVRMIVYGLAAALGGSVIAALLKLVIVA